MAEDVLVVNSEMVKRLRINQGFQRSNETIILEMISASIFMQRSQAEISPEYKQIIPYSILRIGDQVFRYQRTRSGGESRLFNLCSLGVGGHINKIDQSSDTRNKLSILEQARKREIMEEFDCNLIEPPELIGTINDDSNDVGSVHLGILYAYQLLMPQVVPNEKGNFTQFGLISVVDLKKQIDQYETWSQIVISEYL